MANIALLWTQLQLASDIIRSMDTSVNPCQDFYQFACGHYPKKVKLDEDKASIGPMVEMSQKIIKDLKILLETPDQDPSSSTPSSKFVHQHYQACMNTEAQEKLGLDPCKNVIDSFDGWPVLLGDAWKGGDYDWVKMNARMTRKNGGSYILDFDNGADYKDSTRRILKIDQPSLGLGKRDYYVNKNHSKLIDGYFHYMVNTSEQLGGDHLAAKSELEQVLQFETALAEISVRDEDRRDINLLYNPISIKDLKLKYPKINFKTWFDEIGALGWKFDDSDMVNVDSPLFLEKLPDVLDRFSPRTLANYQMWRLASRLPRYLAPSLRENYRQFNQMLTGVPKFKPRWEECVNELLENAGMPVGAVYVKKHFSEESKKEIDEMIMTIKDAMKLTIDNADWMDESTRNYARKKLSAIIYNMAYPADQINNETWLMKRYKTAQITNDQYMNNIVSIWGSSMDKTVQEYREPINRTEWYEGFATVNAWYSASKNRMTFPAGILRFPLYTPHAPTHVNYGRIGMVMGHELTHGFDDTGRQFDADGNFVEWWTNETLKEFKKGAKCIIDQYSNVLDKTTGLHLNGENTQGENIADNGGIKLAYKAYQSKRKTDISADAVLPQLTSFNYTSDQLFFISYGQIWCKIMRPETLKRLIITDTHSPAEYRVNVVLRNSQDFANAFQCPVGSPMNPRDKCKIW